jgi:hypothetical protein
MTTITQERAALTRVGRPLRTREQAGFRFQSYATARPVVEPATLVFVHITITNPRNYASDDAHARAVEAIGISRFPSTGISYNRLVFQSGRAQEGQPIGRRGAHTVNDKNITRCATTGCPSKGTAIPSAATNLNSVVRAYAICQNVNDAVTDAQLDSLARTIAADMLAGFVRRDARIHGHRCVAYKDCPAAKMWARMAELRRLVSHYLSVGFIPKPAPTPSPEVDEMTPTQMQELKDFIEKRTQAYAVANNNYTRQVLGTATSALSNLITTSLAKMASDDEADEARAEAAVAELKTLVQQLETKIDELPDVPPVTEPPKA